MTTATLMTSSAPNTAAHSSVPPDNRVDTTGTTATATKTEPSELKPELSQVSITAPDAAVKPDEKINWSNHTVSLKINGIPASETAGINFKFTEETTDLTTGVKTPAQFVIEVKGHQYSFESNGTPLAAAQEQSYKFKLEFTGDKDPRIKEVKATEQAFKLASCLLANAAKDPKALQQAEAELNKAFSRLSGIVGFSVENVNPGLTNLTLDPRALAIKGLVDENNSKAENEFTEKLNDPKNDEAALQAKLEANRLVFIDAAALGYSKSQMMVNTAMGITAVGVRTKEEVKSGNTARSSFVIGVHGIDVTVNGKSEGKIAPESLSVRLEKFRDSAKMCQDEGVKSTCDSIKEACQTMLPNVDANDSSKTLLGSKAAWAALQSGALTGGKFTVEGNGYLDESVDLLGASVEITIKKGSTLRTCGLFKEGTVFIVESGATLLIDALPDSKFKLDVKEGARIGGTLHGEVSGEIHGDASLLKSNGVTKWGAGKDGKTQMTHKDLLGMIYDPRLIGGGLEQIIGEKCKEFSAKGFAKLLDAEFNDLSDKKMRALLQESGHQLKALPDGSFVVAGDAPDRATLFALDRNREFRVTDLVSEGGKPWIDLEESQILLNAGITDTKRAFKRPLEAFAYLLSRTDPAGDAIATKPIKGGLGIVAEETELPAAA